MSEKRTAMEVDLMKRAQAIKQQQIARDLGQRAEQMVADLFLQIVQSRKRVELETTVEEVER